MEDSLRAAIATGGLVAHYQPVVELPSGRVSGVEALARWTDPVLGSVSPDRFIPLAESTGLILELGEWVLRAACQEFATPGVGEPADLSVAVNVSPVQLEHPGFVDLVMGVLAESGLPAGRLCLEITETAAISDVQATSARLSELRARGVQIALDDFGTGYSSLTMLRSLPWSIVKIDRSFVERVARSAQDAVLVRLVIEAAHTLGLRVCAEGIEDSDQARQLVAMGCDLAQGWYYGRAEPPERLAHTLRGIGAPDVIPADAPPPVPLGSADELVLVTSPNLVITYAASTSMAMMGRTPRELVGTHLADYFPLEVAADPRGPAAGLAGHWLHRVQHRDGVDRWFDTVTRALREDDGSTVEFIAVCRDVTAAVSAQDDLADSEAKFRHAFDDAPTGMALSGLDGRILRVNAAFAEMLGRAPADLLQCTVDEITHVDDRGQDHANLGDLNSRSMTTHDVVKRYLHQDGTAVPTHVRASVVGDRQGRLAYVIAHISAARPPQPLAPER